MLKHMPTVRYSFNGEQHLYLLSEMFMMTSSILKFANLVSLTCNHRVRVLVHVV
jgi:hypothetical protein